MKPYPRQNQSDTAPVTPETAPVDRLLTAAGGAYRRAAAEQRSLPPGAGERMLRSILAGVGPGGKTVGRTPARPRSWFQILARPLAYGVMGAAAAIAWVVWITPSGQPPAQVLFRGAKGAITTAKAEPVQPGQIIVCRQEPGILLQLDNKAQVFLKPDSAIEVVTDRILALRTGDIWVYHTGKPGDLTILAPQGMVVPLGTVFGVKAGLPSTGEFRVTVLKGDVKVSRQSTTCQVNAGHQMEWPFASPKPQIAARPVTVPNWTTQIIAGYRNEFFKQYFPGLQTGT